MILSSFMVFLANNPVHSVLFLILTFCSCGAVLLMFHTEFFGLIFIIIYVGAIAILFLFVVMMLNVKFQKNSFLADNGTISVLIISTICFSVVSYLYNAVNQTFLHDNVSELTSTNQFSVKFNEIDQLINIEVLGQVLYNYYIIPFLLSGLILLVALLGAVVLTLKFSEIRKTQFVFRQLSRKDNFLTFFK